MEAEVRPSQDPETSSAPPSVSPPGPPHLPSTSSIYAALSAHPFSHDADFQSGLASLTSDPSISEEDLHETIFQAQCFYFSRKYNLPPIDPEDYKSWLAATQPVVNNTQTAIDYKEPAPTSTDEVSAEEEDHRPTHIAAQPLETPTSGSATTTLAPQPEIKTTTTAQIPPDPAPTEAAAPPPPPYPSSFESIVDLITRNQPIPGIEEIPDTVLDASLSTPNQTARRRKPWEKEDPSTSSGDVEPVLGDAVEDSSGGKPTGVVGILQPIRKLKDGEGTNPGALTGEIAR